MSQATTYKRRYSHAGKAWHGMGVFPHSNTVDEINIGFIDEDGGTCGEFCIAFEALRGRVSPRLMVYHDGWAALNRCRDLLDALAALDNTAPSPDEVCRLLTSLGFEDITPRVRPSEVPAV